jgi:hypothetical protein
MNEPSVLGAMWRKSIRKPLAPLNPRRCNRLQFLYPQRLGRAVVRRNEDDGVGHHRVGNLGTEDGSDDDDENERRKQIERVHRGATRGCLISRRRNPSPSRAAPPERHGRGHRREGRSGRDLSPVDHGGEDVPVTPAPLEHICVTRAKRKNPAFTRWVKDLPAASYSPTGSPRQYHHRWRA